MKIKVNFINGALFGLVCGIVGGAVWVIQHGRFPSPFIENPMLAVATHTIIALVVGVALRFIPTGSFDERGIKTFNTLSWYKRVKWEEVISTKVLNLVVIKYVLLYTSCSKWAVWVPINITNREQLFASMANSGNEILKVHTMA